MEQAIIPFLLYLLFQMFVLMVGASIVSTELSVLGFIRVFVIGHLTMMALLELLAVPMILLHWKYDVLFYSFLIIFLLLAMIGLRKIFRKVKEHEPSIHKLHEEGNNLSILFFVVAVLLILFQSLIYFFGMHLDEDDSAWLVEANDALIYGDMLLRNPSSGEFIGRFSRVKDVTSPWPMIFAFFSRILINERVTVVAHTVFASFELIVMYGIYFL